MAQQVIDSQEAEIAEMRTMLERMGVEAPQGLWMPGSIAELEALILDGRIRLQSNPLLISACMSAATEHDAFDNRWFSKRKGLLTLLREALFREESALFDNDASNQADDADAALQELGADAVAVAALLALYKNQRRAILLVFDDRDTDASRSDAALVRGYLESIRVPLAVWTPGRGKGPAAAAWGRVEAVGTMKEMRAAFERLKENLDAQRIIWVGGRHLPQSITLSPEAAAVVELAR